MIFLYVLPEQDEMFTEKMLETLKYEHFLWRSNKHACIRRCTRETDEFR